MTKCKLKREGSNVVQKIFYVGERRDLKRDEWNREKITKKETVIWKKEEKMYRKIS